MREKCLFKSIVVTSKLKQEPRTHNVRAKRLIGTLGERSLHAALKNWYARADDLKEVEVDGFHVDILRHNLLVEIQTAHFYSLKRKLNLLTERHPLRLVYPIAQDKWIVRLAKDGVTRLGRRKSPKKGNIFHLFDELVSIPEFIKNPNFTLEVLLIQEEEMRCDDGTGSWRRGGLRIADHCLIDVLSQHLFKHPIDFLELVPSDLPEPFTTKDLADGIRQPRWVAQQMAYCLRHMGVIEVRGKKGNALLYGVGCQVVNCFT